MRNNIKEMRITTFEFKRARSCIVETLMVVAPDDVTVSVGADVPHVALPHVLPPPPPPLPGRQSPELLHGKPPPTHPQPRSSDLSLVSRNSCEEGGGSVEGIIVALARARCGIGDGAGGEEKRELGGVQPNHFFV
jgi:hypothetical protein